LQVRVMLCDAAGQPLTGADEETRRVVMAWVAPWFNARRFVALLDPELQHFLVAEGGVGTSYPLLVEEAYDLAHEPDCELVLRHGMQQV
jgi:hypothetical protein